LGFSDKIAKLDPQIWSFMSYNPPRLRPPRKFIGGTPEQWDESAMHEDPDASKDLPPVMVAEQVTGRAGA